MPQFARGISYTPSFSEGMATMGKAMQGRRAQEFEDESNELASRAWMGDQAAQDELMARNPELGQEIAEGVEKRQSVDLQRNVDKDERFKEDMEGVMSQIGAFTTFEEAAAYGQRMTDMMAEKYPDRIQQHGMPTTFNEEAFNEIRIITGGGAGEPVGVPFRATDPKDRSKTVMGQQTRLKNGRTVTTYLKDEDGNLIRPAEYDAGLAFDMAYGKGTGAKEALIDLADDDALAKLSADAKVAIGPLRRQTMGTVGMITAMKNHPGLDSVVGVGWLNPAKFVPGSEAHNFQILAEQAQGKVFSQAYETLKGGGPITEFESAKAGQAIARMNTSQSKVEYLAALNDFETALREGYRLKLDEARGVSIAFDVEAEAAELPARLGGAAQYTRSNPAQPTSAEERNALPAGSVYMTPNGEMRVKK